ncbi:unnamed protein product [Fraxinus pennsylvanica]|uniref:PORR domain-containing protein n=1 Tax=Fraxinus pennsylvanica TaxID=56036 RepID=A0AAD2DSY6_9LAMI|nr:unnamed protein product [Fraxinus pennsylvanica]
MRRISQFRDMPFISPYSDFSELRSGTPEKEKHAFGGVHEILSLTGDRDSVFQHEAYHNSQLIEKDVMSCVALINLVFLPPAKLIFLLLPVSSLPWIHLILYIACGMSVGIKL